jgi:hypothetical protein
LVVYYCERCRRAVSDEDIEAGRARLLPEGSVLCPQCAASATETQAGRPGLPAQDLPSQEPLAPPKRSHARLASAPPPEPEEIRLVSVRAQVAIICSLFGALLIGVVVLLYFTMRSAPRPPETGPFHTEADQPPVSSAVVSDTQPPRQGDPGLLAEYFRLGEGDAFVFPPVTSGTLFSLKQSKLDRPAAITEANWGLRVTGRLIIEEDGQYGFKAVCKGGTLRLLLDGQEVAVGQDPGKKAGKPQLKKGPHSLCLEFRAREAGLQFDLKWTPRGKNAQPIPEKLLVLPSQ